MKTRTDAPTALPEIVKKDKRGKYYRNDMVATTNEFATEHQFKDPIMKSRRVKPLDTQAALLQARKIGGHHRYKSVNMAV